MNFESDQSRLPIKPADEVNMVDRKKVALAPRRQNEALPTPPKTIQQPFYPNMSPHGPKYQTNFIAGAGATAPGLEEI